MDELKPCPLCGAEGYGERWTDAWIYCSNEECWFACEDGRQPRNVWQALPRRGRLQAQPTRGGKAMWTKEELKNHLDAGLKGALDDREKAAKDGRPADSIAAHANWLKALELWMKYFADDE